MKYVKIRKLGNVVNPYHANSTFGESKPFHFGSFINEPEVGQRFNVGAINSEYRGISTSPVVEIIDSQTFATLNSIYKWETTNEMP